MNTNIKKSVVAIIPARGGSKGIPRKNIRDVGGKPLIAYTIEAALASELTDEVFVNSEDNEIREVSEQYGAKTMSRPEQYSHDNTIQEVDHLLMWCITQLESQGHHIDILVLLYPTAPLRTVDHIDRTIRLVRDEGCDSALTLVKDNSYLWRVHQDGTTEPTNYDPAKRGPRQKENWNQWVENKAVYAMKRDLLMTTGCRLGGKIGYVEMSKLESVDVDLPDDLELVKKLING